MELSGNWAAKRNRKMFANIGFIALVIFAYTQVGNGKKMREPDVQIDRLNLHIYGDNEQNLKFTDTDVRMNKDVYNRLGSATLDDLRKVGSGKNFRISTLMALLGESPKKNHRRRRKGTRKNGLPMRQPQDGLVFGTNGGAYSDDYDETEGGTETTSREQQQQQFEDEKDRSDEAKGSRSPKPGPRKQRPNKGSKSGAEGKLVQQKAGRVESGQRPEVPRRLTGSESGIGGGTRTIKGDGKGGQGQRNNGGRRAGGKRRNPPRGRPGHVRHRWSMGESSPESGDSGSGLLSGLGNGLGKALSGLGGAVGSIAETGGTKVKKMSKLGDVGTDLMSGLGHAVANNIRDAKFGSAGGGGAEGSGDHWQRLPGPNEQDLSTATDDAFQQGGGAGNKNVSDIDTVTNVVGAAAEEDEAGEGEGALLDDDVAGSGGGPAETERQPTLSDKGDDDANGAADVVGEIDKPGLSDQEKDAETSGDREALGEQQQQQQDPDLEDTTEKGGGDATRDENVGAADASGGAPEQQQGQEDVAEETTAAAANEKEEQPIAEIEAPDPAEQYEKQQEPAPPLPGTSRYCSTQNEMSSLYSIPPTCCTSKYECDLSIEYIRTNELTMMKPSMNRLRDCNCDFEFYNCLTTNESSHRRIHPILLFVNDKCAIQKFHRSDTSQQIGYKIINTASFIIFPLYA